MVQADELDRAELLVAGFPAAQLRGPHDPPAPGELRLVADRPTDAASGPVPVAGCPGRTAVAGIARGTGGAPGAVCRTDGGAERWPRRAPAGPGSAPRWPTTRRCS